MSAAQPVPDLPDLMLTPLIARALEEDFGQAGDLTTAATIDPATRYRAQLNARETGRVSGLQVARLTFAAVDPSLTITQHVGEGAAVERGTCLMEIEGAAASILMAERVALNFAGRLSGIATLTAAFVAETGGHPTRITCTRKTTPGLRVVEKRAVLHGGGANHRFALSDAILIKDNHIAAAGGVRPVLDRVAARAGHMVRVEIEVDRLDQLQEVLDAGTAHVVLLDNMDTPTLARAVELVGGRLVTEASGNMSLDRIAEVAATGVDYISAGALTHSARTLDLGLDF
ncbi:carboxylating nicotinate-nucleotide diphosphorylase [Oceanomicrobium pacificus]|uniref:Probable nicotinate-nucleotide pyrophosphorylase [carboxylating] n=1 Tax=Oceanomicrobium pacificus TaxID=2692916 RepID=A0A6B0TRQ1_9RHOB|nr:carboxylating nicotinate-nucleotide diphosphorylase [Oceanomicrobium pacificus]MXU63882.1 carboxylating nicotinate-nucleotide diphosphorylase [Oceanomicrobium pacificus]